MYNELKKSLEDKDQAKTGHSSLREEEKHDTLEQHIEKGRLSMASHQRKKALQRKPSWKCEISVNVEKTKQT
jgi:hypothetical protein